MRIDREDVSTIDRPELPTLSLQILRWVEKHGRQNSAQLAEATRANRNTLKVRLRDLAEAGLIQRHGKARATWHSHAGNHREKGN